ncbi:helix-turn-helix transcriptional regulator [Spirillospora sp. NPDC047279]|uniref:helix-turn-helix transcriptional regulator n=1 Tax=Spirillospora sp. NPDC047279 TaxID=3155478 RepID=UPI0033EBED89
MDRKELAAFLRSRRDGIRPQDVGLSAGSRRRAPGLRREEVAQLAGMSVDYYIRLEQGRGPRPSRQILAALARALRLTDDERAYLHNVAGEMAGTPAGPPHDVPAGILHLLDRLDDTPAYVLSAEYDVLAWNTMAAGLITDFSALELRDRNMIRWFFDAETDALLEQDPDFLAFARDSVADLRAAAGRYPGDPGIRDLVAELTTRSGLFRRLWAERRVEIRRSSTKRMIHPVVGEMELHCDVLLVPDKDQKVILYTAAPGTPAHESLKLLRVVGTQDLTTH